MNDTMTADEFLAMNSKGKKGSKYGAQRTRGYASKAEADYADVLALQMQSGEIIAIAKQPKFVLGVPENVYVADWLIYLADGRQVAIDVKGMETAKFRRDVKLWRSYGPCELHIVTRDGTRWNTRQVPRGKKIKDANNCSHREETL